MKRLPELYDAFNKKEREQFLKWFTTKIMIKDKKIVDIAYTPGFQAMVDRDIVRISETWLERWYEFGRIDWVSELEYPEWTVKEVGRFLSLKN